MADAEAQQAPQPQHPTPRVIHFATGNKKKLEEARRALPGRRAGRASRSCFSRRSRARAAAKRFPRPAGAARRSIQLPGAARTHPGSPRPAPMHQVVAILEAGQKLPFSVDSVKIDLPELQARPGAARAGPLFG
jgi:hypothetical protein